MTNLFDRLKSTIAIFAVLAVLAGVLPVFYNSALGAGTTAYVQGKVSSDQTGTTNTLTFDSNVASGDAIVVFLGWYTSSVTLNSVTDSLGNCYSGYNLLNNPTTFGGSDAALAYCTNISGGPDTITATFSASVESIFEAHEISGVAASPALDGSGIGTVSFDTAYTTPSIATAQSGDYVFAGMFDVSGNNKTLSAVNSPFSLRLNGLNISTADAVQTTAGSIQATGTLSGNASALTGIIALKPGIGGGGDTTAPSTPLNLSATAISASAINLTWTTSTDNVGVTGYTIYRGGIQIGISTINSYSDSGLSASTQYTYTIDAYDAAGNHSAQSSSASATTQAGQQAGNYPWSGILDPSRAIDWTSGVGFTIPNYSTNCATQPTLSAGVSAASANATAISDAISSCDSTHNVVNIPAGTYYLAGIQYNGKSNVVLRGVNPNSTYIYLTAGTGCGGYVGVGVCMAGGNLYAQSANANPGGSTVCNWSAGYAKGSTTIILNNCGSPPPVGKILVIDQADDGADNGGIWLCSGFDAAASPKCQQNGANQNADGRVINGVQYSEQQETMITNVSGSGAGPYTVTISPGVYFNNIRSSQTPGAWWSATNITQAGIENLTLDHSLDTSSNIGGLVIWCSQCWFRNIRSIKGGNTNHWDLISDFQPVVRDSYFYGSQHGGSNSYTIQMEEVSGALVENNIMQNTISPDIKDAVTGSVSSYNFTPFISFGNYMQGMYASHNSGSAYNLLEGNSTTEFLGDNVWGTSDLITIFRNQATGWQPNYINQTFPISFNNGVRGINIIGNVFGQPGYHTQYQAYATSASAGVHQNTYGGSVLSGPGTVNQSIYELGWTDAGGLGVCNSDMACDSLVFSTLMRWGNYDTVNGSVQWNASEASPAAVPYANFNPAPSSHTLPPSFYLSAKPSWFGSVPFPAYGPDVSSGSTGICSGGTYDGVEALSSGQCTGGSLTASAWAGHANANPAQVCYLNIMHGPPDGSGGVLAFDANNCYYGSSADTTPPSPPTGVSVN